MCRFLGWALLVSGVWSAVAHADVSRTALETLQAAATGPHQDQTECADAWKQVASATIDDVPEILDSLDSASKVGVNWISSALDAVIQREDAAGNQVNLASLASFVLDSQRGPLGRETALELLEQKDVALAAETTRKLLDDPVARMRRPAVAALLERAKSANSDNEKLALYREAFAAALDEDHVVASAVALRKLNHPVDHVKKFGFLMHWQIVGPFDYLDGKGFEKAYPPELLTLDNFAGDAGIFSSVEYAGKDGPVKWKSFVNTARNGEVNLNKAIDQLRDSIAYGAMVFESSKDQDVELRLRQQNSAKLWLNGKEVFSQSIGHTGNSFDQYVVPVRLQKGPNLIVVKSCQFAGEIEHPFFNTWQFGVRVCDSTGNAVLATNRPPTPELDPLPGQASESKSDSNE